MELDSLVEQFLACGLKFVGIVGEDCEQVEDIIDEFWPAMASTRRDSS